MENEKRSVFPVSFLTYKSIRKIHEGEQTYELLTMEHITKAYTDRVLLNDVAFSINENEKIGVIGINGMGSLRC